MPEINLGDFSQVGQIPPEGCYRFKVMQRPRVEQNASKDGSNIILKLNLIDFPEADSAFENYPVTVWLSLKVASYPFLKKQMQALTQTPWDSEDTVLTVDDDNVLEKPDLEDLTFIGECVHKDYQNAPTLNIKNWYPDDGSVEIMVAGSGDGELPELM